MLPNTNRVLAVDLLRAGVVLPPVLFVPDLARVLHLSSGAVLALHHRGGLPLGQVGRRYAISRGRFLAWLDHETIIQVPPKADLDPATSGERPGYSPGGEAGNAPHATDGKDGTTGTSTEVPS